MAQFALTIFLSAFLLFQVQPVVGRFILPWFGGGASVWTACMLFFQALLLGGYAYAHLLNSRLRPRSQMLVHGVLLAASFAFLPLSPAADIWRTHVVELPTAGILLLLAMRIGLPYLLLSSTGPLLQSWFSRTHPGRSPYRLYSLSNLGSLLALVSYPFVFEPILTLRWQGWLWSGAYVVFAVLCGWCAWRARRVGAGAAAQPKSDPSQPPPTTAPPQPEQQPTRGKVLLWVSLAAVGSLMLLATTNQICQDLPVNPMLWVVPLAIYLLTFIICFDRDRWYNRIVFVPLMGVSIVVVNFMMHDLRSLVEMVDLPIAPMWLQIVVYLLTMFASCMVCHGELVRSKPAPRYLTTFYLAIAAGGALGGAVAAVAAPLIFKDYWEYHLGLGAASLLAVICIYRAQRAKLTQRQRRFGLAAGAAIFIVLTASLLIQIAENGLRDVQTIRNFYGVLHVRENRNVVYTGPIRRVVHGQTMHGMQFLSDDPPEHRRRWPTSYYGWDSGVGLAIEHMAGGPDADPRRPLRIGVIGLGAGTIAALTGPGDRLTFYEINPVVPKLAHQFFTYLDDAPATIDIKLGDARVVLDSQPPQKFDVLAIDAFNSDAIPLHLITAEAFDIYRKHIKPDGLIAFHVSNRYVDLRPVVHALAEQAGYHVVTIVSTMSPLQFGTTRAAWLIVTGNESFIASPKVQLAADPPYPPDARRITWTDDFASLLNVMTKDGSRWTARWDKAPNRGHFVVDLAQLIGIKHEHRLLWKLRRLYADTDGGYPLMVVTLPGLPRSANGGRTPLADVAAMRFRAYGMIKHTAGDRGVMVIIAVREHESRIHLGEGWKKAHHEEAQMILERTINRGLREGKSSEGIELGVAHLSEMIRREHRRQLDEAAK